MIAAVAPTVVALEAVGLALLLAAVVFLAILTVHRLILRRSLERREQLLERLRPLAFELLEGDVELLALDDDEAEALAELLGRYGRRLRLDARGFAVRWFEESGVVDRQLAALRSRRAWRRAWAAFALGDIGATRAAPQLLDALRDHDAEVRAAAARSLGRLGITEAVEPLVTAYGDGRLPRLVVGSALLELGPVAVPQLLPILHSEDAVARAESLELLGLLGEGVDPALLLAALRDASAEVRAQAARALGRLGAGEGTAALRRALDDRIPFVRAAAAEALGQIGDPVALPDLLEVARRDGHLPARAAARAAAEIDVEALAGEAAPYLEEARSVAGLRR